MKAKTLALLSALGMALTSVSVYSLTPPGGAKWHRETTSPDSNPTGSLEVAAPQNELAHFSVGKTLMMDGRLGQSKLLRTSSGETFVMVEVSAADDADAKVQAPVNLGLVIDRSGSMKGSRLQNAIAAATGAVGRLHDGDVVSVVTFDTKTTVVVPPTTIAPGMRERISSDIRSITLGGDTCISCGIEDAMVQLEQTRDKINKMIVLSDGDANHGIRDVPGFRSMAQRAQDRGTSITTIGVDVDYNEKILSAIAQESNGRHYFVENDAALARVFESEAETLTRTVASGAEVSVDLAPGIELDRVLDRSFRRLGNRVVIPLGTFARGETKSILMKVRAPRQIEGVVPVADVELSFRDLVGDGAAKCSGKLAVEVTSDATQVAEVDAVVSGRIQRSETATALKEANALFEQGRADDAQRRLARQSANLSQVAARAKAAAPSPRKLDVGRDFDGQAAALDEANRSFATPPPAAGAAPARPQETRQGKAGVRRNIDRADAFGL